MLAGRGYFNLVHEAGLLSKTFKSFRKDALDKGDTAAGFLKQDQNQQDLLCLLILGMDLQDVQEAIQEDFKGIAMRRATLDGNSGAGIIRERQCRTLSKNALALSTQAVMSASLLQQALGSVDGSVRFSGNTSLVERMFLKQPARKRPAESPQGGVGGNRTGEHACLVYFCCFPLCLVVCCQILSIVAAVSSCHHFSHSDLRSVSFLVGRLWHQVEEKSKTVYRWWRWSWSWWLRLQAAKVQTRWWCWW
jgi:hypothetical protein